MALSEEVRTQFYEHYVEHVGEEAAEAMLSQFPTRDVDELATKEFVQLEISKVHVEIAALRLEIAHQTDRFMTRMQVAFGFATGFLSVLLTALAILTR
jgi:hypothetical protein